MAKKGRKAGSRPAKRKAVARTPPAAGADNGKTARVYEHTEEKLLLRPDVGLQ